MSITLSEISVPAIPAIPAKKIIEGSAAFVITDGQIKIKTTSPGVSHLEAQVPDGKSWDVYIKVKIIESDA